MCIVRQRAYPLHISWCMVPSQFFTELIMIRCDLADQGRWPTSWGEPPSRIYRLTYPSKVYWDANVEVSMTLNPSTCCHWQCTCCFFEKKLSLPTPVTSHRPLFSECFCSHLHLVSICQHKLPMASSYPHWSWFYPWPLPAVTPKSQSGATDHRPRRRQSVGSCDQSKRWGPHGTIPGMTHNI